jgi:hypothetical protein
MTTVASTTIVTNLKSLSASTGLTFKSAGAQGIDMAGMLSLALAKALELKACLTSVVRATDGGDPNLTTLNDILASLT